MNSSHMYIRCPVCGKLSLQRNFEHDDSERQLGVAVQHFVGRGQGGFEWEHLAGDEDALELLEGALEAALSQVRSALEEMRGY